jgi:ubiquinone/menaquinone biosynthesis C-methylase UbiE
MEIQALKDHLNDIERRTRDTDWQRTLEERKLKELEHHNLQRSTKAQKDLPADTYELLHGNKKFYATVKLSDDYLDHWLRTRVPGKVVLDYACGNGGQAIRAARYGAKFVIGTDLSDVSIANARRAAEEAGVADRCFFLQADCENTGLPRDSIDVVLCSGVLHHLDLTYVFPELRRILQPGGVAFALEALDYNPAIKLYRKLTPSMRTEWEKNHILSLKDLRFARNFFEVRDVRFWHLFSIGAVALRRHDRVFRATLSLFNRLDQWLLRLPGVQLLSWQFTFELHKR